VKTMKYNRNHLQCVPEFVNKALLIIAFAAVGMASAAIAQPQPAADSRPAIAQTASSPELRTPENQRYRIGPGDLLEIRIFNRPQLSRDAVRVEGNGMIRMPLVEDEIQAACKSEGELAKEIATRYLRYYRNLQVDVFIKEYHAREVALIGAVNEQGRYQMQRRLRLLELLTFAKGPSDKAGETINIVRGPRTDLCANSSDSADEGGFISLRLNDTLRGEEKANPFIQAGDIVTIPEAAQVYVVGNVYSPRTLPLKEPITVSHAIAMAGGVLRDSKTDRIHIIRQVPGSGGQSELYVSLKDIASKKAEDVLLRPNDIVEVSVSTGKSLIRSLLGAVAPTVGQLPVRVIP
jgi:polysaccharide export outer membrane protein